LISSVKLKNHVQGVVAPHIDMREQKEKSIMLSSFSCSSVVYS
jgi:hypothetical protein